MVTTTMACRAGLIASLGRIAERGLPNEVVGVVGADEVGVACELVNVEPQDATAFCASVSLDAIEAAEDELRQRGLHVVGHFHSHPRGRAAPSRADSAYITPDRALFLIGFRDGPTPDVRCWARGHGRYPVELTIRIIEGDDGVLA